MSTSAIAVAEIDRLRFSWPGHSKFSLAVPHLRIARGEHVFLFGPSGCGKSTILGLIGGVLTPSTGEVRLLGRPFSAASAAQRDRYRADHIGIIFQQFNLVPYLSVLDNVLLPCRFSPLRKQRAIDAAGDIRTAAARLLTHLDLPSNDWQQVATSLSVGQQQRVAAARALIGQPELIMADEPTSALDSERQQSFLNLLLQEAHQAASTVLFVSHDRRLAQGFTRHLKLPELCSPGDTF